MLDLTVNIIENFIKGFDLSGSIMSLDRNSETTKINIAEGSSTFHARSGMFLDVNAANYEITEVDYNKSITVNGVIKEASMYTVNSPKYFHGTPLMTNARLNGAEVLDKLPMIYLYEIIRERDKQINSAIVRESDLRLFFLDTADFSDWNTDDHYSKRLLGLNSLVDYFIEQARGNTCQFYLYETDFNRINHVKWGRFKDDQGHVTSLFDDELTGVELSFTLPLKDCFN